MTGTYVKLEILGESHVHEHAQAILQRSITDEEYVALAGAQPGDNVSVRFLQHPDIRYIELRMGRPARSNRRGHQAIAIVSALGKWEGNPVLSIQFIIVPLHLRQQGIASNIIATQVKAAQRMGIQKIVGIAEKHNVQWGERFGYYAMPRIGFDATFTDKEKHQLPSELASMQTLQQIMADESARELWREHGFNIYVEFDTRPDSPSVQVLQNYLKEKGRMWEMIPDVPPSVQRVTTFE